MDHQRTVIYHCKRILLTTPNPLQNRKPPGGKEEGCKTVTKYLLWSNDVLKQLICHFYAKLDVFSKVKIGNCIFAEFQLYNIDIIDFELIIRSSFPESTLVLNELDLFYQMRSFHSLY